MAINFPNTPLDGDTYVVNNITFTYNAVNSAWTSNQNVDITGTGTSVVVSDTPPPTPSAGDLWTNSVDMSLNIYYVDSTSSQWVDLNQTDIDLSGYDTSSQVDTKISNVSVDLSGYDTSVQVDTKIAAIPDTDLSSYDTSAQVDTKIAAIPDTDLSAYDTSAQVDTKVASIVDSAPETLNTLNELAAALGDDANHVATMTTLIGTKSDAAHTHDYAPTVHTHDLSNYDTSSEVDTKISNVSVDLSGYDTSIQVDTKIESLILQAVSSGSVSAGDKLVLNSDGTVSSIEVALNINDPLDISSSYTSILGYDDFSNISISFSPDNPNKFLLSYAVAYNSSAGVFMHGEIIEGGAPSISWIGSITRNAQGACKGTSVSYGPNDTYAYLISGQDKSYIGYGNTINISSASHILLQNDQLGQHSEFALSIDPYGSGKLAVSYNQQGYPYTYNQVLKIYDITSGNLSLIYTGEVSSKTTDSTKITWDPFNVGRFMATTGSSAYDNIYDVIKLITVNSDNTVSIHDTLTNRQSTHISFLPDIIDKFVLINGSTAYVGNITNNIISIGNGYGIGGTCLGLGTQKYKRFSVGFISGGSMVRECVINDDDSISFESYHLIYSNYNGPYGWNSSNKFVTAFAAVDDGWKTKYSFGQLPTYITATNLTSNNFVGISSDTYTTGQSVNVDVVGHVSDNQFNLTPGTSYYVVGDGSLSTIPDEYNAFVGKSITSTSILILPKDTDLSGYDTSSEVDTKISNVSVDLSAYDTSVQVDTKVASIVDSAPTTLNTLNELAAALGDDANYATTMTTLVGTKADQSTTYTKTEVDTSLNLKSDKTTTYTKTEVDSAVLSNWTEDANGHILPNVNDTHDIGSSTLKVRDIYMSGSTIHLGDQSISADADGIKMPAIKIGTGANAVSLSASSDGKLVQTATVGGVVQTPTSSTGASVIVSDTPPVSPSSGDLWTDSTTMKMFIYYEDADSSQWVEVSGSSGASASAGGSGGTTNLTAGVIWDNHDSTRTEYDESLTVLADGTEVLTHVADPEDLRSVYIEKFVEANDSGSELIITSSLSDQSSSAHEVTNTGVTLDSSVTHSGSGSLYFNGSSYLTVTPHESLTIGTDDFTVESWVKTTPNTGYPQLFNTAVPYTTAGSIRLALSPSNKWSVWSATSHIIDSTSAVDLSGWVHVALVRSSGVMTIYTNGVADGSVSNSTNFAPNQFYIGGIGDGSYIYTGYIEDFRFSKTARYTANFTPTQISFDTYWQLESFDDWGVQFTSPTQTTLVNKTGDDATIRARVTKPTSQSTKEYGALALTHNSVALDSTGLEFGAGDVKTLTHVEDASNLRSVYIEKYVEAPNYTLVANLTSDNATFISEITAIEDHHDGGSNLGLVSFLTSGVNAPTWDGGLSVMHENYFSANNYIIDAGLGKKFQVGNLNTYTTNASFADGPVAVYVSDDNITWTQIYSETEMRSGSPYTRTMSGIGRYFKVKSLPVHGQSQWFLNGGNNSIVEWDLSIVSVGVVSTYWQLETFNDWGVQFTDSTTTTITNNTGSTATARFRITAPTASAGGSGGGVTAETQTQIDDNELFSLIGL